MMYDLLEELGIDTTVAHPLKVWTIADAKIKHNSIDARTLAHLLRAGLIPEVHVPAKDVREQKNLFRVTIPVSAIAISTVAIISFLWAWNEFLAPFLFINTDLYKPITVGMYYFVGDELTYWNSMCAAAVLATIPGIVFFMIAQKYIVKGLTMGSIKG